MICNACLIIICFVQCRWIDNQNLFHETMELSKSAKPSVGRLLSREKSQQTLKQQSEVINE